MCQSRETPGMWNPRYGVLPLSVDVGTWGETYLSGLYVSLGPLERESRGVATLVLGLNEVIPTDRTIEKERRKKVTYVPQ